MAADPFGERSLVDAQRVRVEAIGEPGQRRFRLMVIADGDGWYLFSSPISIGLWIAAIVGFVAPMFMRGLLKKPQRITD